MLCLGRTDSNTLDATRSLLHLGLTAQQLITADRESIPPEAAETHHTVYRIVDGDDPDCASWYADWLVGLSELPEILSAKPIRSHLVHALVQLDRDYLGAQPADPWESWYAVRLPGLPLSP